MNVFLSTQRNVSPPYTPGSDKPFSLLTTQREQYLEGTQRPTPRPLTFQELRSRPLPMSGDKQRVKHLEAIQRYEFPGFEREVWEPTTVYRIPCRNATQYGFYAIVFGTHEQPCLRLARHPHLTTFWATVLERYRIFGGAPQRRLTKVVELEDALSIACRKTYNNASRSVNLEYIVGYDSVHFLDPLTVNVRLSSTVLPLPGLGQDIVTMPMAKANSIVGHRNRTYVFDHDPQIDMVWGHAWSCLSSYERMLHLCPYDHAVWSLWDKLPKPRVNTARYLLYHANTPTVADLSASPAFVRKPLR